MRKIVLLALLIFIHVIAISGSYMAYLNGEGISEGLILFVFVDTILGHPLSAIFKGLQNRNPIDFNLMLIVLSGLGILYMTVFSGVGIYHYVSGTDNLAHLIAAPSAFIFVIMIFYMNLNSLTEASESDTIHQNITKKIPKFFKKQSL